MDVIFSFQTLEGGQVPTQLVKISKGVQSLLCPYPGPHASAQMLQSLLPTQASPQHLSFPGPISVTDSGIQQMSLWGTHEDKTPWLMFVL